MNVKRINGVEFIQRTSESDTCTGCFFDTSGPCEAVSNGYLCEYRKILLKRRLPKIKKVKTMPEKGQFVVIWEYNGLPWCDTYLWTEYGLMVAGECGDFEEFVDPLCLAWHKGNKGACVKFFVYKKCI